MDKERFKELMEESNSRRAAIHVTKSSDYADNVDVLGNFKRISKMASLLKLDITKPDHVALFMVLLKLDRIVNLTRGERVPMNESVIDSFDDLINYANLAMAIRIED